MQDSIYFFNKTSKELQKKQQVLRTKKNVILETWQKFYEFFDIYFQKVVFFYLIGYF